MLDGSERESRRAAKQEREDERDGHHMYIYVSSVGLTANACMDASLCLSSTVVGALQAIKP